MSEENRIGTYQFVAEPFHVDFNGRLTMGVLGNHLLNCAGFHANDRGFGIATLNEDNYTWVLSRLAIELDEMPYQYENFSVQTWVENVYRLFTDRNFAIIDKDGKKIGYARSVWAMINLNTRKPETDVERQHTNVQKMKMLGAEVRPVTSGNMTLKDATNEAIRDWCCHPTDTHYIIGSTVGPHPYPDMVARLQSVISEEIRKQLQQQECRDYPDYLIACVGGGSNAAGTIYHYIDDRRVKIVLAEAGGKGVDSGLSAATIHLGEEGIIHGARTLVMQNEDGQIEEPYSISAGLDYPGIGPVHANLAAQKRATVLAVDDDEALYAAFELTRLEGIIPALESAHALGALPKMHFKPEDVVVLTVSGRGDKDIETYIKQMKNDENISL